uniref:Uncharacterized protein n=1 Tax=Romanomermis culicivorax TaxID=13658 RepID=A0A915HQX9_ROMCU
MKDATTGKLTFDNSLYNSGNISRLAGLTSLSMTSEKTGKFEQIGRSRKNEKTLPITNTVLKTHMTINIPWYKETEAK